MFSCELKVAINAPKHTKATNNNSSETFILYCPKIISPISVYCTATKLLTCPQDSSRV